MSKCPVCKKEVYDFKEVPVLCKRCEEAFENDKFYELLEKKKTLEKLIKKAEEKFGKIRPCCPLGQQKTWWDCLTTWETKGVPELILWVNDVKQSTHIVKMD